MMFAFTVLAYTCKIKKETLMMIVPMNLISAGTWRLGIHTPEINVAGFAGWMDLNPFEMFASSCDRRFAEVKYAKAKNYHGIIVELYIFILGLECTRSFDLRHCLRTLSPGFR